MKTANRIAKFYDHDEPEPPEDPKEREDYWTETLFKALANARKLMRSKDDAVSLAATQEVLQIARTRMRHGKRIDGTGGSTITHDEHHDMLDEMNGRKKAVKPTDFAGIPASTGVGSPETDDDRLKPGLQQSSREDTEQAAFNAHVDAIEKLAPQMAKKIGFTRVRIPRPAHIEFVKSVMKHFGKSAKDISADVMRDELWLSLKDMKAEQEETMKSSALPA